MIEAKGIQGKYLEYLGKPLVRKEDEIFYGDMSDKFYLYILILSQKKNDKFNMEIPDQVMVQILPTHGVKTIEKQKIVTSLADAFDLGLAWLERANRT